MTVLIDSSAWIEYLLGTPKGAHVKERIDQEQHLFTATINLSEIYKYFLSHAAKEADTAIQLVLERSLIVPLDVPIALNAAKVVREKQLGLADAIVLASARSHKLKVVTFDNDFRGVEDAVVL